MPRFLKQLLTALATALILILSFAFSLVVFGVVLVAGALAWFYLWWKTRALRQQVREAPRPTETGGRIIEGEVIREVSIEERRER